jgi:hypothetical protein
MNISEILLWIVIFATPTMLMAGLVVMFYRYYAG